MIELENEKSGSVNKNKAKKKNVAEFHEFILQPKPQNKSFIDLQACSIVIAGHMALLFFYYYYLFFLFLLVYWPRLSWSINMQKKN